MSRIRVKTDYLVEGNYGTTEKRTLYAEHNNSSDVVNFFDDSGDCIFTVEDTQDNNLCDAIVRLYTPSEINGVLKNDIQYMDDVDKIKCKI